VQIENKYFYSTLRTLMATSRGTTVAQQHASLFPTRLALARWTRGGDIPHVYASEQNLPIRSTWYAQAEQRFQGWLDAGGFHGADEDDLDCVLQDADMAPVGIEDGQAADERVAAAFPVPGISCWPAPQRKTSRRNQG
jgi:hypothetical protein